MLEISKEAVQQLKEFRNRRGPDTCVRIGILSGSTTGPTLGVTVDECSEADESYLFGDLQVVVEKGLLGYCEKITVDYVTQEGGCSSGGFKLTPKNAI